MINLPSNYHIDIRKLESIFNDMTNSYKIYWFIGIFEEIIQGKKCITFKEVTTHMISKAWYPLLKYHLNFGLQDQLDKTVRMINEKYINNVNIPSEKLYKMLLECKDKEVNSLI